MTAEIGLILVILLTAIILFATERIRVDVVAMMVLLSLLLLGLLDTGEAFSGFSNPAVITVWAIYMLSDGINRAGVADYLGQQILRVAGTSEGRLIAVIMLTVGGMSAFTNNIGATAILLPAIITISKQAKVPASKLLIPLSFGSLLGGVTTLIGTPPNLLVSAALQEAGFAPFKLLDYTPMGLIILLTSIIYMVFFGRHLLPDRENGDESFTGQYELRKYLTELRVLPKSRLIDKTLLESKLGNRYGLTILAVQREGQTIPGTQKDIRLQAGDRLIARSNAGNLAKVQRELKVEFDASDSSITEEIVSENAGIYEVVISQKAQFVGQTIRQTNFRGRWGLTVMALRHEEQIITGSIGDVPLQLGDVLLVHGSMNRIASLQQNNQFLLLNPLQYEVRRYEKAAITITIFAVLIALVLLGKLHISTAAVTGVVLYILTGCLTMEEAYKAVEWKSVFLIAGMLPLGIAMEKTGTAQFLADQVISLVGSFGARGIMLGLIVLTSILTGFMSNAAAAVLVAPIAISTALTVGVSPHTFVMGVGVAASSAFLLPVGHQANILVYGPGNYRFFDFTRVGLPLTIMIWLLVVIFLPLFFPF